MPPLTRDPVLVEAGSSTDAEFSSEARPVSEMGPPAATGSFDLLPHMGVSNPGRVPLYPPRRSAITPVLSRSHIQLTSISHNMRPREEWFTTASLTDVTHFINRLLLRCFHRVTYNNGTSFQ